MIEMRLSATDLMRVRFAFSPLAELVHALRALRDPASHALHVPFVRRASRALGGLDVAVLDALLRPRGAYLPDFLTPIASSPLATLDGDLATLRATPTGQVREQLGWAFPDGVPAALDTLHADPPAGLDALAVTLRTVWDRLLARTWPDLRALLEADVVHRARTLADGGAEALFADLHPAVALHGETLRIARPHDAVVDLAGRGLLLAPSVFAWPDVLVMFDEPVQPAIVYPARGLALLWDAPRAAAPGALAGLLGRTRAAALEALELPVSTTRLAERLEISAATAAYHLAALRAAGLARASRSGREVVYGRTATGDAVVRSAS
jgi:DNA-binding transcriptional ArsR family regulator